MLFGKKSHVDFLSRYDEELKNKRDSKGGGWRGSVKGLGAQCPTGQNFESWGVTNNQEFKPPTRARRDPLTDKFRTWKIHRTFYAQSTVTYCVMQLNSTGGESVKAQVVDNVPKSKNAPSASRANNNSGRICVAQVWCSVSHSPELICASANSCSDP